MEAILRLTATINWGEVETLVVAGVITWLFTLLAGIRNRGYSVKFTGENRA